MSVVKITSFVGETNDGQWYIKLTDTYEDVSVVCNNIEEYKEKLTDISVQYGSDIEIVWEKSKDLSIKNYTLVHEEMAKLQEEYADEIEKINNGLN